MQKNYNPDVLSCLANLSNDEVFTPPQLANQILDMLPQDLWSNKKTTFLDPCCKSGVFLREIAKRLIIGLEKEIPNLQKRLNHIYTKQLFGIAITDLTSLLSRRSTYCSKRANGEYSICDTFKTNDGNIIFERVEHTWKNSRCMYCGANQSEYDRDNSLETHAYQFIHILKPEEIFNMKFDVIIGNPPYQMNDGGNGSSAKPLYHLFIDQAQKLNPRFLTMIVPSRWFAGGKGLDDFREKMMHDTRIRALYDFFDATECFPGIDLSGGVCYFLWDRDNKGDCKIVSHLNGKVNEQNRPLLEKDETSFIRFNEAVSIVHKIKEQKREGLLNYVSSRKPFGIPTTIRPQNDNDGKNNIRMYAYPNNGYISEKMVIQNKQWLPLYKVYLAKAYGERGNFPYLVIGKPFLGEPNSCCSETYLVCNPTPSEQCAKNCISYLKTKFARFLVLLMKNTQNAAKGVYQFVPMQDFSEEWTDEKLYKKYGLTQDEIDFIESMIRPME
ncbi:MAG: Eco57I restriction-modification methylase domain-containing protein [Alphaproteobacteria bacterium]|nr:Eco57I restriction-modification methylase domain-containing protein [Alphaproteobacteria bacterium]